MRDPDTVMAATEMNDAVGSVAQEQNCFQFVRPLAPNPQGKQHPVHVGNAGVRVPGRQRVEKAKEQRDRGWKSDVDKKWAGEWTVAPRAGDRTETGALPWDSSYEQF